MILASSLWIGGAETVMRHLAQTIDRTRFNVTVCHLKHRGHIGDELEREGVDIVGISDSTDAKVDYFTFRKVLRLVRQRQIAVIHTHTSHGLVDATLCKLFRPGLKVVHTFHFGNYPHTRPRILWMEWIFSRLADRLLAVGDIQRRQLQSVYRFRAGAIDTIWNGVKLPQIVAGDSFRRKSGAQPGDIVVGTIATFIEQKGLRDLMKVARRIRDAHPNVRFLVVGEGALRAELEAMSQELGLGDTVTLTGWVTNAAEVALPAFDVFFQPSLWEAMSVVILEAMASGKAIVATRVGENAKVLEDGVNGLLVNAKDTAGMASALERLIVDADLRRRLGDAARRSVEQHFTVGQMTRAYEEVYLDTLR